MKWWLQCAIAVCCVLVTYQGIRTLRAAESALQSGRNGLVALPQTIQDADSAVKKFSQATDDLSGVIAAERKAQTAQLRESQKVIAAVKEAVVRTNCQLNGGPGCRGLLPQATTTLEDSAQQIQLLAKSGQDTLQSASFLLNSANRRIQDQRIDDVLAHFDESSLHLDLATASGASILAHGDHVAAYWDKKLTTPPRLAKTITLEALHLITIPLR